MILWVINEEDFVTSTAPIIIFARTLLLTRHTTRLAVHTPTDRESAVAGIIRELNNTGDARNMRGIRVTIVVVKKQQ